MHKYHSHKQIRTAEISITPFAGGPAETALKRRHETSSSMLLPADYLRLKVGNINLSALDSGPVLLRERSIPQQAVRGSAFTVGRVRVIERGQLPALLPTN